MATFLLIDPAAGRRAWLRVFLSPPHEVVECSSFRESLTACTGATFKAAFIAWPQGVRPAEADSPNWSCEQAVLLISDTAQAQSAGEWCKRVLRQDKITLMHCLDGYLNSSEISRAVSRVLDTPAVVFPEMVGSSPAMRKLMELAARAAANDHSVLICGEPGTGKEALARWIHARSARGQRPFEPFDCSGLEAATAASELFGHEKGAFPWAAQTKRGLLAAANEGTLYIREACDLHRTLQSKLLRLLERPETGIERLGGQQPHNVDVRLTAGCCRPLSERLGEEFSRDLYYRLRQNYLETPPLRSRPSDIPELARHLLARQQGTFARGLKWEPRAMSALQRYQWPGNLNELEEVVVEAALKTEAGGEIKFDHLPPRIRIAAEPVSTAVAPVPTPSSRPNGDPTSSEPSFPDVGFCYDGYRMLKRLAKPKYSRVFLAQRETGARLRVVKFSQARNHEQCEAVERIMALADMELEAKKYMIPIEHASNCPVGPWYMVVLPCLDDCHHGRKIDQVLYRPHTFQEWIDKRKPDSILKTPDEESVLDCLVEILHALDFFHSNGLVMNDVKPSNFGFFEGRLVAIDFGGFTGIGEPAHEVTPVYDLPEPREGQPAEDIYAVVKMMAEALYDVSPEDLQPAKVEELAKDYLDQGLLFDRLFWEIIKRGMNLAPIFRFKNAGSLIEQLEEMKRKLREDKKARNSVGRIK